MCFSPLARAFDLLSPFDHPPSAMEYTSARSSVSKQLSKKPCPLLSVGQSEPSPSQLATTVVKSEKPDLEKQVIELRADRLNCDVLRRLLKSRGHVTSGRKESLVARVVELFGNKDDIVDPGVARTPIIRLNFKAPKVPLSMPPAQNTQKSKKQPQYRRGKYRTLSLRLKENLQLMDMDDF